MPAMCGIRIAEVASRTPIRLGYALHCLAHFRSGWKRFPTGKSADQGTAL